jgi:hypothetical protein
LLTDLSKREEAVQGMHAALNRLDMLLAEEPTKDLPRRQIQVSMAYLVGDLAHQLEESKKEKEALAAFRDAERRWKEVVATYGEDDITLDALTWCRRRIAEIEAP